MHPLRFAITVAVMIVTAGSAAAGPPSYLLLRQGESPGPKHHAGEPAAKYYDVRTDGYAYGYFGVGPRSHWSRSFGVQRTTKQWSQW